MEEVTHRIHEHDTRITPLPRLIKRRGTDRHTETGLSVNWSPLLLRILRILRTETDRNSCYVQYFWLDVEMYVRMSATARVDRQGR